LNLREVIERIESLSEDQVVFGFPGDDGWTGDTEVRMLALQALRTECLPYQQCEKAAPGGA
jgi:hypothetical protein